MPIVIFVTWSTPWQRFKRKTPNEEIVLSECIGRVEAEEMAQEWAKTHSPDGAPYAIYAEVYQIVEEGA